MTVTVHKAEMFFPKIIEMMQCFGDLMLIDRLFCHRFIFNNCVIVVAPFKPMKT